MHVNTVAQLLHRLLNEDIEACITPCMCIGSMEESNMSLFIHVPFHIGVVDLKCEQI